MNIAGIVCEYNPFHNGHAYHLSKALSVCDQAVCLMSGHYVQRAEPSLIDKWSRTRMALQAGASLVLELPTVCSTLSAEGYASESVRLLNAAGCITHLVFGAECDDLALLEEAALVLCDEPDEFRQQLKKDLDAGLGYAAARSCALAGMLKCPEDLIKSPNNILAIEYLKAIQKQHAHLKPVLIRRIGNYHGVQGENGYASASLIRAKILSGQDIAQDVPAESLKILLNTKKAPSLDDWSSSFYEALLRQDPERLSQIRDVSEGLENRILNTFDHPISISEALDLLSTKRYPRSRFRRIFLNILLDIRKDEPKPEYLRVLGFRTDCQDVLHRLTEEAALPVITNPPAAVHYLERESYFTDLYMMHLSGKRGEEWTRPIVKET